MTIWSSQLRHNFFNHALFSCVEQEIDRIKGWILCNVAFCLGTSTAVLAVDLPEIQKIQVPLFEPLCYPPKHEAKQNDFLEAPLVHEVTHQQYGSWRRWQGREQSTRQQEIVKPTLLPNKFSFSGYSEPGTQPWPFPFSTEFLEFVEEKTNKQKTSEQCPCCIPQTWCPVSSPVSSFFYCYHNTKAVTPKVLLVQRWF